MNIFGASLRFLGIAALTIASMMAVAGPMEPKAAGTKTISATSVSSATAVAAPTTPPPLFSLEITNAGAATVFLEFGDGSTTAAVATGYPVLSGQTKVVTLPMSATHVAAITASGTATVYVTTGRGE